MARLVGVDLPREKRVEIALTYIFGVGRTRSQEMLTATGINPNVRVKDCLRAILLSCAIILKETSKSKVISVVRLQLISDAKLRFSATKEFVTAEVCRCAGNVPTPTHVLARVHALLSLVRRR